MATHGERFSGSIGLDSSDVEDMVCDEVPDWQDPVEGYGQTSKTPDPDCLVILNHGEAGDIFAAAHAEQAAIDARWAEWRSAAEEEHRMFHPETEGEDN